MMWKIYEHKNVEKGIDKLPGQVVKKYELWKNLIFRHGPEILLKFPGFHDEALKGRWEGWRSSRLNLQCRVIYQANKQEITVFVIEITAHQY